MIYQKLEEYDQLPEPLQYRHVTYDPCRKPTPADFTWEREWRICTEVVSFKPEEVTVILPTRSLADKLRQHYVDIWKNARDQGSDIPIVIPWHFVVLEDLGVSVKFPEVNVQVNLSTEIHTAGSFAPFTQTGNVDPSPVPLQGPSTK